LTPPLSIHQRPQLTLYTIAHILDQLLAQGHTVVTTVRDAAKAQKIHDRYPSADLTTVIVPDIARPDAFDAAVATPGIEVVLHAASPFHFNFTDPKTELIDPAVVGTTSILRAIARSAPSVRRVVVTSSFAAILDEATMADPAHTFSEASWNPVTVDDIHRSPATAYRASKTLAERAAWDFVRDPANGASFDLVTVNPPMVFGPIVHHLHNGLAGINTSNERLVQLLRGGRRDEIPPTGQAFIWVDVRDVAAAHIKAGLEIPEAGGRRLFATAGTFSNSQIADIVRRNFSEYKDVVPVEGTKGGELPAEDTRFKYDNRATTELLGIDWIPLEKSFVDAVESLKPYGL